MSAYTDKDLTVPIHASFIDNELETYESDTKIHRIIMDFRIWHEE